MDAEIFIFIFRRGVAKLVIVTVIYIEKVVVVVVVDLVRWLTNEEGTGSTSIVYLLPVLLQCTVACRRRHVPLPSVHPPCS